MKNNSNIRIWAIVVIVALISAAVGSITNSITGNIVKAYSYSKPSGFQEIYTKAEVDNLIKNLSTKSEILNMLANRCYKISPRADLNNQCDKTCEAGFNIGKNLTAKGVAIGSFSGILYTAVKQDEQKDLEFSTTFDFGSITQPIPSCGFDSSNNCLQHKEEFMELERGYNSTTTSIEIIGVDSRCICCIA